MDPMIPIDRIMPRPKLLTLVGKSSGKYTEIKEKVMVINNLAAAARPSYRILKFMLVFWGSSEYRKMKLRQMSSAIPEVTKIPNFLRMLVIRDVDTAMPTTSAEAKMNAFVSMLKPRSLMD